MRKIILSISFVFATLSTVFGQVNIEPPRSKANTPAFAIFIDRATYEQTKDAVHSYKKSVEDDGLPTYIVSGEFQSPDEVKKYIVELYKSKQSLEGVVFIGDIPIPMIRNAQHMTTAFKMNETKFPFEQSSVPSDRFYDDLNLSFKYLRQDSVNKALHYYKLSENSVQSLNPSIYSARIRYPKAKGGDAYKAINAYLQKVANAHRNNILDKFVGFTGAAYNSECILAWKDDLKAYKEDFPYIGNDVRSLKQLNFRMDDFMKFKLFDELQRPDVDVLLMRKHGTPTEELINNAPSGISTESRVEAIRRDLYASLRRAQKRKANLDSLQQVYMKKYDLSKAFFSRLNDPDLIRQDSIVNANASIHTVDLGKLKTNPTYVILDACYNGSFHEDDYVAGYYIFNDGKTITVQGNTRNVLQDKWTMNMTGLLSYGVRFGKVHNMGVTLESHLIGDPTFHFGTRASEDLNTKLNTGDLAYWTTLLEKPDPIYQAIALRKLADSNHQFSTTLFEYFSNSKFRIVRLQALRLLSKYNNADFTEAVKKGLTEEYEMIARQAAIYAGKIGDTSLLSVLAQVWVGDKSRKRVQYNIESSLQLFEKSLVEEALVKAIAQSSRSNKSEEILQVKHSFSMKRYYENDFQKLMNKGTPLAVRLDNVRSIRNYNFHENVASYIQILSDSQEPVELRITMAEALGWFNHSKVKPQIIAACKVLKKTNIPQELYEEIDQTLNRLN